MGSTVHEVLEDLYRRQKKSPDEKVMLIQMIDKFEALWNENWTEDVKVVKEGMKKEDYFLSGKQILTEYYAQYQPFDKEKTLSVEERIDLNIDGFRLMGFIDRVALNEENGNLEIHDYKTSGTLPDIIFLQNDRQLSLYQMGVRKKYTQYADRETEVIFHYLKFNKEFRFKKTDEEMETVKKNVVDLIQTIELSSWENNFKACVGKLCDWCEFSALCPAFQKAKTMK